MNKKANKPLFSGKIPFAGSHGGATSSPRPVSSRPASSSSSRPSSSARRRGALSRPVAPARSSSPGEQIG